MAKRVVNAPNRFQDISTADERAKAERKLELDAKYAAVIPYRMANSPHKLDGFEGEDYQIVFLRLDNAPDIKGEPLTDVDGFIVDDNGRYIDTNGNLVTDANRVRIERTGVDFEGNRTIDGERVDVNGNVIVAGNRRVDPSGNRIVDGGNRRDDNRGVDASGEDVDPNGNTVVSDADGAPVNPAEVAKTAGTLGTVSRRRNR